jgi:hypothetical protein
VKKWANEMNSTFSEEEMKMAKIHMKQSSTSLTMKVKQEWEKGG